MIIEIPLPNENNNECRRVLMELADRLPQALCYGIIKNVFYLDLDTKAPDIKDTLYR